MEQLPSVEAGVTVVAGDGAREALYRLVDRRVADEPGTAYWVDAGNAASPRAFREYASRATERRVRVARAFTAYQHYELLRGLPGTVTSRTSLVVAPNLDALYDVDDVPGFEADAMFDASLALLTAVSRAVSIPVLVTADGERAETVREAADRTLDATDTRAGLRVDGEGFRTDVYWDAWGFQTTIPYWVDLLGAVEERERMVGEPVRVVG